jgi:hypothetical protein
MDESSRRRCVPAPASFVARPTMQTRALCWRMGRKVPLADVATPQVVLALCVESSLELAWRHSASGGFGGIAQKTCNAAEPPESSLRRSPRQPSPPFRGNCAYKTVPCGLRGAAHRLPPCASTIDRQMDRPIPMPCDLVVKKASKIRSVWLRSIPVPESSTATLTSLEASSSDLIVKRRSRSDTEFIASFHRRYNSLAASRLRASTASYCSKAFFASYTSCSSLRDRAAR